MAEDPRYLRNQSRSVHRIYRRNKRIIHWGVVLWLVVASGLSAVATLDVFTNRGWGYGTKDIWAGFLMDLFGLALWVFATAVNNLVLAISRRVYGPEPTGPIEG